MKKFAVTGLAAIACAALFTLVHKQDEPVAAENAEPQKIAVADAATQAADPDLDFTEMNQTVQAAYLYKLAARPEEFEGKSLRLPGRFTTTVGEKDGKRYFGCLVGNVEGGCPCCTQTLLFEFEPKEAELWRTNFPPENTFITVTGRLKMISETSYGQSYDIPRLMDSDVVIRR